MVQTDFFQPLLRREVGLLGRCVSLGQNKIRAVMPHMLFETTTSVLQRPKKVCDTDLTLSGISTKFLFLNTPFRLIP